MAIDKYPKIAPSRPGTQVIIDSTGLEGSATDSTKAIVVFGSATSGEPNQLYNLTSLSQAKEIFKSGDLVDFAEIAWSPSTDTVGAGNIYAARVDSAQQATLTKGNLTINSEVWGASANNISLTLEDNTLTNSKRLTIDDGVLNDREVYDNLGNIFTVSYSGSQAVATIAIASGVLTISAGADAEHVDPIATYKLVNYSDLMTIISDINNHDGFDAEFTPFGEKGVSPVLLEEQSGDLKSEGDFTVKAVAADIALQTEYSGLVSIVAKDNTTVANFTGQLSGGSNGSVPASWASSFQILAEQDAPYAYYVVALSPDATVHAELSAFVTEQAASGFPLVSIVGGNAGESISKLLGRQRALYSSRVAMTAIEPIVTMSDGRSLSVPPYLATAFIAGIASGIPVGDKVEYKHLRISGLARSFTYDQLNQLHQNGVIVAEKVRGISNNGSYRVVSDVTTQNTKSDPVQSELSLREITDFLAVELKDMLDSTFVGTRATDTSASIIKAHVSSFFLQQMNAGVIQTYSEDNISVVIENGIARINAILSPSRGINNIYMTLDYESSTLSA